MIRHTVFILLAIATFTLCTLVNASEAIFEYECATVDTQSRNESVELNNKKAIIEIYQLFKDWRIAIDDNDVNKLVSLVTENAEFWSNRAPPLKGRKALKDVFMDFLAEYSFTQKYECHELIIRDDMAFIRGIEHNTKIPIKGGAAIFTQQRTMSILRNTKDGKWLFARGMTNLPESKNN